MRYLLLSSFVCIATCALQAAGTSAASTRPTVPIQAFVRSEPAKPGEFKAIYQFDGPSGSMPQSDLLNLGGIFYGTTASGGKPSCNCGTIFSVTPSGDVRVLYKFQGPPDAAQPQAGLTQVHGTLYGTTARGGFNARCPGGCGTVFATTLSGDERVIHRFSGVDYNYFCCTFAAATEGYDPVAPLTDVNGVLYGTTLYGGSGYCQHVGGDNTCGTIYRVTTDGTLATLYSFSGVGGYPTVGLTSLNGTLYGTSQNGGINGECLLGCGMVFSITKNAEFSPVFEFGNDNNSGAHPLTAVIAFGGMLYGTTDAFGEPGGAGVLFSVTTSGSLFTLHHFGSGTDGVRARARLLAVNGDLYGTTSAGGRYGRGTIFKVALAHAGAGRSGADTILHDFTGGLDGAAPLAGLTYLNGSLYGTASAGGKHNYGTIFRQTI